MHRRSEKFGLEGWGYCTGCIPKVRWDQNSRQLLLSSYLPPIGTHIILEMKDDIVASELKDPIWHSLEWQIGSFSFEATICVIFNILNKINSNLKWHYINPFSARIVSIRQHLTYLDVRVWRIKTVPALKEVKYLQWPMTHSIGIQMKQKKLTKTFNMLISNWKETLGLSGLYNGISAL